jgi:3-hydroxybutyrate dehydrogenase
MDIHEPDIDRESLLVLQDPGFTTDHVCLVTGCSSGIGRATAIGAAVNNLMTVGLDVDDAGGRQTQQMARDFGGQMIFIHCDITADDELTQAVDEAAKMGAIRYLANIAGIQHIDPLEHFPMEIYDRMQSLMLRAPFRLAQLVIPHMRRSGEGIGVIGNMASIHAHVCTGNKPVYNIVKFGLKALSQSISAEGAGRIRAFTVSTGFVKTPLALKQIPAQAIQRGISEEAVVTDVMMGRSQVKEMMAPVDVANLFVFGFSSYSRYLVGGDLLFDGGTVLTY